MIIMMKKFNNLLFGEVVLLYESVTVIVSRSLFWKSIVLEGGMFWKNGMFWIRIVLPGARLRYQALRVD